MIRILKLWLQLILTVIGLAPADSCFVRGESLSFRARGSPLFSEFKNRLTPIWGTALRGRCMVQGSHNGSFYY